MSDTPTPIQAATSIDINSPEDSDSVAAVVSLYQKQKKIYARAVSGWFAGWRWALVWVLVLACRVAWC